MTTQKRVGAFRYTAAYSFKISSLCFIKARWSVVFGPLGKQTLMTWAHLNSTCTVWLCRSPLEQSESLGTNFIRRRLQEHLCFPGRIKIHPICVFLCVGLMSHHPVLLKAESCHDNRPMLKATPCKIQKDLKGPISISFHKPVFLSLVSVRGLFLRSGESISVFICWSEVWPCKGR